eukprot:scaffold8065_cov267-Pinguiococcus_pyrenoidosus.AAC.15
MYLRFFQLACLRCSFVFVLHGCYTAALCSSRPGGFDSHCPERFGTGSIKWDRYVDRQSVRPMWVADMDFQSAPCIRKALQDRVDHGVFGYAAPTPEVYRSIKGYLRREHDWEVEGEAIVFLPGVVQGITACVLAFSEPGDAVASPTPVYPPILSTPRSLGRTTLELPMRAPESPGEPWTFDFEAMRSTLANSPQRPKLLILCSPQNPTSRVLDTTELREFLSLAQEFDMTICSDEIHCDLVLGDQKHRPTATLSSEAASRTVTLMSPSKTYNVPGLGIAFAIIPDPVRFPRRSSPPALESRAARAHVLLGKGRIVLLP